MHSTTNTTHCDVFIMLSLPENVLWLLLLTKYTQRVFVYDANGLSLLQ